MSGKLNGKLNDDLTHLLSTVKPATPEEIESQRAGMLNYKPGERGAQLPEDPEVYHIWAFNRGEWSKVPHTIVGVPIEWSNEWKNPYQGWFDAGWYPYLHLDQHNSNIVFMRHDGDYRFLVYFMDGPDEILVTDLPSFLMLLPDIQRLRDLTRQSDSDHDKYCQEMAKLRKKYAGAGK